MNTEDVFTFIKPCDSAKQQLTTDMEKFVCIALTAR